MRNRIKMLIAFLLWAPFVIVVGADLVDRLAHPGLTDIQSFNRWVTYLLVALIPAIAGFILASQAIADESEED